MITLQLAAGSLAGEKALEEARRTKAEGASPQEAAALAVFLASSASQGLSGRLINALWDDWRSLGFRLHEVMASQPYTLRRISGDSGIRR